MAAEGYDFVEDRTRDGRKFRMLNIVDECTRECLAIRVARKLGSADVIDVLADLFMVRGSPAFIRSDNGPEFIATAVRGWIGGVAPRRHSLSQVARERTAMWNPSTASCATSCSMRRCSTHWPKRGC